MASRVFVRCLIDKTHFLLVVLVHLCAASSHSMCACVFVCVLLIIIIIILPIIIIIILTIIIIITITATTTTIVIKIITRIIIIIMIIITAADQLHQRDAPVPLQPARLRGRDGGGGGGGGVHRRLLGRTGRQPRGALSLRRRAVRSHRDAQRGVHLPQGHRRVFRGQAPARQRQERQAGR
ncbi:hypothetical protein T492DRAFT_319894 [Pavlovales sp. CCMP2436]|nr:hypothetical protein T492DRAFT_319894 [Pavlovales sp. CCMP2436]